MHNHETIHWHRLKSRGFRNMTTSYTTLDPHPHDWDASRRSEVSFIEFMNDRVTDLQKIEGWLGEDAVRESLLHRVDPDQPERHATVAVRVVADRSCAVATLNWTGLGNMVTDIIIAIPASQTEKFDPKMPLARITTLADHGKHILGEQMQLTVKKDVGEPAVFSTSLVDGPTEICRIMSDLTMTLGRAMIRRAIRWDGTRVVESVEGIGKPEYVVGLSYEWPMRLCFFVERPCGASFSEGLAAALEDVGFSVVLDPRFEGTDECAWYASRNPDHLINPAISK